MSIKNSDPKPVFDRLRERLAAHASELELACDTTDRYGLEAPIGPATLGFIPGGSEPKSRD